MRLVPVVSIRADDTRAEKWEEKIGERPGLVGVYVKMGRGIYDKI